MITKEIAIEILERMVINGYCPSKTFQSDIDCILELLKQNKKTSSVPLLSTELMTPVTNNTTEDNQIYNLVNKSREQVFQSFYDHETGNSFTDLFIKDLFFKSKSYLENHNEKCFYNVIDTLRLEFKISFILSKHIRDLLLNFSIIETDYHGVTRVKKETKEDYIFNLLLAINKRLDKIDRKLNYE